MRYSGMENTVMTRSTNRGRKFPAEILTASEVKALLYAPNDRYPTGLRNRALIAAIYGAGLRVQETLDLRPADVNVEDRSVRILHGKGDEARFAGIDQGALIHIVRWIDARRTRGIRGKVLFCTLAGGPVDQRYVRAMLGRMAKRADIDKRVHPHGLRHTHAAELERAGFTVSEIQQQLGHTHLNTTAIYLNHISPSARIAKIGLRREVL
jgi:site-specific recombinase XerD